MTVMFKDIYADDHARTKDYQPDNLDAREILYADDTILNCKDTKAMNRLMQEIELATEQYRLKQNKKKCECIHMGKTSDIKFADGTPLSKTEVSTYLGCKIDKKTNVDPEIRHRIAESTAMWE